MATLSTNSYCLTKVCFVLKRRSESPGCHWIKRWKQSRTESKLTAEDAALVSAPLRFKVASKTLRLPRKVWVCVWEREVCVCLSQLLSLSPAPAAASTHTRTHRSTLTQTRPLMVEMRSHVHLFFRPAPSNTHRVCVFTVQPYWYIHIYIYIS